MTEKRFIIVNMGLDGRLIKEDGKIIELERVVDLLNENEQLKYALNQRTEQCDKYYQKNEQLKQSINNLKDTIIKITIAYQRKYDRNIVDLVDEVHDEDITDLIKELKE